MNRLDEPGLMLRLLIFNATPKAAESAFVNAGSRRYKECFESSLLRHAGRETQIEFVELRVADGEQLAKGTTLEDFDGVWISGSPLNVYRLEQPSVREQIEFTRAIWDLGIPAFGSCWGLQLMTAALGGAVRLNPRGREIGIARRITLSDEGRRHPLLGRRPLAFDALCSHEDEVERLPPFGSVLASNAVSRVQAAAMTEGARSFWGVQYHPEFDFATTAAIISTRVERHIDEGLARSPAEVAAVVEDYRALDERPLRADLAWKHGLAVDVLDPTERTLEFGNWLEAQVKPYALARRRAA